MKNKVKISKNLIFDLENYMVNFTKGMAEKVRDELTREALFAVNKFYGDYTPKSYKRHRYNFINNSFRGYYKNPHNQVIRGGVELTPESMDNIYKPYKYIDKTDGEEKDYNITEYVFNLVYAGYHGNIAMLNSAYNVYKMDPSPLEIILNRKDYIVNNINSYQQYGYEKAKGGTYSTLLF